MQFDPSSIRNGARLTAYKLPRGLEEARGFELLANRDGVTLGGPDALELVGILGDGLGHFEVAEGEVMVPIAEGLRLLADSYARGESLDLCGGLWPLMLSWQDQGGQFVGIANANKH